MSHDDFAVEPIPGLPAVPPDGERILWQGRPEWRAVARRVFHVPLIATYFGLLCAWRVATALHDGMAMRDMLTNLGFLVLLGVVTTGFFLWLSWGIGRTTVYTVTTRRVVMRFGVALPMTVNLPFAQIAGASLRLHPGDTGDIPLSLVPERPISWAVLWPHARPWHMARPEPMLRCIREPQAVARLIAGAFAEAVPARVAVGTEVRETAPAGGRAVAAAG